MSGIDLKEGWDNSNKLTARSKSNSIRHDPTTQQNSEENHGMMSWTRWFREFRGKSSTKEADSYNASKSKDRRRVKLNRANSALPCHFKHSEFMEGEEDKTGRSEKKEKKLDKRRYSFNGGSNTKLSRNARTHGLDDRRLQNRSNLNSSAKLQSNHSNTIDVAAELSNFNEQHLAMTGNEQPKMTQSSFNRKSSAANHNIPAKLCCKPSAFQKLDETGSASTKTTVPPVPPVRNSSSLLVGRYLTSANSEKYPSWSPCDLPARYSSKSTDMSENEQLVNDGGDVYYPKDISANKQHSCQLNTAMENYENVNELDILKPTKALEEEVRSREKMYMPEMEYELMLTDDNDNTPYPPDRDISLAKSTQMTGTFHQYSHSSQDSSYMSQEGDYAECYMDESRTLLPNVDLEQYTKDFDENAIKGSHQKQPSYAQSEGYHSYVSSNDSAIITPLLDRLRRESDVIVSGEENLIVDRESSASSGSSSDTLKWHGSLSDVSVASSSYQNVGGSNNNISNSQHNIVHSARVQTPQRHHSESVLYLNASTVTQSSDHPQWQDNMQKNHQLSSHLRKLFPVNTYSVYPQPPNFSSSTAPITDSSPVSPKLTVAERIIELERQQLKQLHQQNSIKYTYFDPDKRHKVSDQNLKVIQKKALLSYYERHHSSWRSEPQLSPIPSPPQSHLPRPRLPTPTSRRSSSASDYQGLTNNENCLIQNQDSDNSRDAANDCNSEFANQAELKVNSPYRFDCGSIVTTEIGPIIIGEPISVDDWVPELPPKNKHLRAFISPRRLPSPDMPPPSPPPLVDDEVFISDEPFPPPPPDIISNSPSRNKEISRKPKTTIESCTRNVVLDCSKTTAAEDNYNRDVSHYRNDTNRLMKNITNEQRNKPFSSKKNKCEDSEFFRFSQSLYKEDPTTAERRNQVEPNIPVTMTMPKELHVQVLAVTSGEANTDFLAKRSLFASGYPERQSLWYSSAHKLTATDKLAEMNNQNNECKETHRVTYGPSSTRRIIDSESKKADPSFSSFVLRHSEKFPIKLNAQCLPTTCQLSQSSYRREPRDREKGLPNFEGSYKRTMSPSSSTTTYTTLTNGFVDGPSHFTKDVENTDPKTRKRGENRNLTNGRCESRVQQLKCSTGTAVVSKQPCNMSVFRRVEKATAKERMLQESTSIRPLSTSSREYAFNSLPKNCLLNSSVEEDAVGGGHIKFNVEPKQRSSRAPRTQSDPSSVKDASTAALLTSQSSSSSLNRQKAASNDSLLSVVGIPRSQSDLSNVGSTESGYSSLSLNVPSPSVSPNRLSSTYSAAACSCIATQCDMISARVNGRTKLSQISADGDKNEDELMKYSQKSEIVLKMNASTSDAASQTDSYVAVVARVEPHSEMDDTEDSSNSPDRSTSPILKRKSTEEFDCEEVTRELLSYVPCNHVLYRLLVPKSCTKKSTDYLENVFRTNLIVPFAADNNSSVVKRHRDTRLQKGTITNGKFSYQSETTNINVKQNKNCDTSHDVKNIAHYQLQQKQEKLLITMERKLNLLKSEQVAIIEKCRINDTLGEMISQKVTKTANAQEVAKYKLHIKEIGHITSLLLGLSGRLAKIENSLIELTDTDSSERTNLECKREKLLSQLEEAKALKANIDKRSSAVSASLVKYFSDEEVSEYEYFVHMKFKLLIDCREISEKIEYREQQLTSLKSLLNEQEFS